MKVYKTTKWSNKIEGEKDIERETDNSIFWTSDKGRKNRELKVTSYGQWHNSKEDALEYLHKRILSSIEFEKKRIIQLESDLERIISEQLSQS